MKFLKLKPISVGHIVNYAVNLPSPFEAWKGTIQGTVTEIRDNYAMVEFHKSPSITDTDKVLLRLSLDSITNTYYTFDNERYQQYLDSAKVVEDYNDWVYDYSLDKYFTSPTEAKEYYIDEYGHENVPEYLWTCTRNHIYIPSISNVIGDMLDDLCIDDEYISVDDFKNIKNIQTEIDNANDINSEIYYVETNYESKVKL